jgi:hypothetical protein
MSAAFYFICGMAFGVIVSLLAMAAAIALIDGLDSKDGDK